MERKSTFCRGYSLLEVLIALLVFSIGLLGVAGMMVSAVKGNHQSYYRSQATYIADTIADGMRGNLAAVNGGNYNTGGYIDSFSGSNCTSCDAASLASRNLETWAGMAQTQLPGGAMSVECEQQGAPAFADAASSFNGICQIRLRWAEVGDAGQQADSTLSEFSWMVQP